MGIARAGEPGRPTFDLPDVRTGKPVALADFMDNKAIVVLFIGTACPVNNAYMPTLSRLAKDYQARGVKFVAINSDRLDTSEEVAAHARKHELPFPVLKDERNRAADLFDAKRIPEAFVLDGDR